MDKDNLKKILTKANSLEQGSIGMAKEFINLDTKLDSIQGKTDSFLIEVDGKLSEIKEEIANGIPDNVTEDSIVFDLPEYPEKIEISNFPTLQKVEITNLPKVETPIVNVKAPQVTVEAPVVNIDTETIENELKTSNKTLKEISEKLNEKEESEEIEKVTIVDSKGKPFKFPTPSFVGGSNNDGAIKNVLGNVINPSTEEKQDTIITNQQSNATTSSEEAILLRRLVKLMESNATVDIANRQKVVVEAIPTILGGYTLGGNLANFPTGNAPTMNPSTNYFLQTWSGPVDPRWTNMEQAKINYNTGVRSNLSFN